MYYSNIQVGVFLARPNRFVAEVLRQGEMVLCHVKNTGRCKELLIPGAIVYINESFASKRKTKYDLIAVMKQGKLINMDSQAPNRVFCEYIEQGAFLPNLTLIKPEYQYGDSRFDFYLEQGSTRHLVEVKGVTLEENGVVRFPDAPTERGVKHVNGLISAKEQGLSSWLCFIVQMSGIKCLRPNDQTHPEFGAALRAANRAGVGILALECSVTPNSLTITHSIPIQL